MQPTTAIDPALLRRLIYLGAVGPALAAAGVGAWQADALLTAASLAAAVVLAGAERWVRDRPEAIHTVLAGASLVLIAVMLPVYGGLQGPLLVALASPVLLASLSSDRWLGRATLGIAVALVGFAALVSSLDLVAHHESPLLTIAICIAVLSTISLFTEYSMRRQRTALEHALELEAIARAAVSARDRELSLRRDTQDQLQDALQRAEGASAAKSSFLAAMSHELRTPLNAIIGYSEMLVEESDDPDTTADLQRIEHAGQHLLSLINDVLDLSKIEAGRMKLQPHRLLLERVLDEVEHAVMPQILQRRNTFEVVDDSRTAHFTADPIRLKQVLLNLLSNAAKFTEDGSITLRVTRHENTLAFHVHDSGIGIAPEQLGQLFRPFEQIQNLDRRTAGTGLGLALSRNFAQMMEGEIRVESTPGVGSTFTLTLPVEAPLVQLRQLQDRRIEAAATSAQPKVVCIDGTSTALFLMERRFHQEGFFVVPVADGGDAVEVIRQVQPDLVTVDVHAPHLGGRELLAALRSDDELEHLPVVLCSVDELISIPPMPKVATLTKPIRRKALKGVLRKLLPHLTSVEGLRTRIEPETGGREVHS